jgi:hypothetical protein
VSNASTIRRQIAGTQQLTLAPLSGTVITTTATPFSLNNNALTLTGGGIIPLSTGVTNLYAGTGQVIHIHAAGTVTGAAAASTTLVLGLYEVPAASLPLASTVVTTAQLVTAGATLMGATSARTIASTSDSFTYDAYVQLSANGELVGTFQAQISNATTDAKTATTAVAGLVGEADLNFVLSATLGGTEVGVILNLNEFELSLV